MKLDVLARGDVAEAARVALPDLGQREQLVGCQQTLRDLHPQHLRILGLALSVGSAHEPVGAPPVSRQLAALVPLERGDEFVDLGFVRERQSRAAERLLIIDD